MKATCDINRFTISNGISNDIKNRLLASGVFTQEEDVFVPNISADYQSVISEINSLYKEDLVLDVSNAVLQFAIGEPSDTLLDSYLTPSNIITYNLKAVEILSTEKASKIFAKGKEKGWSMEKMLKELQVPSNQIDIIIQSGLTEPDEIVQDLLVNSSYTVEINTAKTQDKSKTQDNIFTVNNNNYELKYKPETGNKYFKNNQEISEDEFIKANNEYVNSFPTQHYSNLTVAGGTNYTENEIATPAITPSIKGHAQFATSNGIGWFRSDESQQYQDTDIQSIIDNLQKSGQLEINCK